MASQQTSAFAKGAFVPPDSIFDVTRRFVADTNPQKVNLGQGTYRDENGKPWVLPAVRMAKEAIGAQGHEYLPIAGLKEFRDAGVNLAYKGTKALAEGRVASCQSISGTGSLLLVGMALKKANSGIKTVLITDPTWSNHDLLFRSIGYEVKTLPYYKDGAFDYDAYMQALRAADDNSAVILHACAHNPTGCDPSKEQWKEIASVIKEKSIFPVFDSAYLGFNSGDVDEDAWSLRYFIDEVGLEAAVCMSFAKSMGLYGERVGLSTFATSSPEMTRIANSILENSQRATISNPPVYGARIAATVLNNPDSAAQWARDLKTMPGRIQDMRRKLYEELVRLQTPGDWSHIVKQSGMFGYTGISPKQIEHLETKYSIYMAETSRISIAGLNDGNVLYVAKAIDEAVRNI